MSDPTSGDMSECPNCNDTGCLECYDTVIQLLRDDLTENRLCYYKVVEQRNEQAATIAKLETELLETQSRMEQMEKEMTFLKHVKKGYKALQNRNESP